MYVFNFLISEYYAVQRYKSFNVSVDTRTNFLKSLIPPQNTSTIVQ